ncbi:juvenile hormone esterase-like isoform X2 [Anastrepha ludens]|uniref:juvenile hormone esterase-like isoform X2 n=1 Tax=Anastrepha ludens TaxID=28586 RepID=UPI0023B119C8|nr:juvenile hormone esterase-like isoform X2 [Anastrepha ludens]
MFLIKCLILFSLIHCLVLLYWRAQESSPASGIGDTIRKEFFVEQRKITVEGVLNESWTGEKYFAFRGIPYVKPPIGQLRFKDPKPLEELPSFIDARYDGHDCHSIYATNASEDCLVLNIYTPTIIETAALPVLVFIHPGGLYIGSSLSSFISPAYLLSKPLIVVTFNYRLGTLGFLQLGTHEIPGNAGFKDQVHALRWVAKYIQLFGGNPKDITLMGYSAGALSVSLHLVSPMSQGLFHKAIIMSGSVPPQKPLPERAQLELMRKQARILNCTHAMDETEILNCLQQFNGYEITSTLRSLFEFGKGFTNGELCQFAVDIMRGSRLERQFYEEFEKLAPSIFMYADHKGDLSKISAALRERYLRNSSSLDHNNLARLCDFFSDGIIRFGAQRLAELAAPHTKVFPYSFEFRGEFTHLNYPIKPDRVEHMDDLMYLFEMNPSTFKHSESNTAMIRKYTKLVFNFMKKGSLLFGPTYPTGYTKIHRTLEFQPGTFFSKDTYDMWKQLFL